MNRDFTRYTRGGMLLELENQKNHYKVLLQPRKSMHISEENNRKLNFSLNQNNKHEKKKSMLRDQQNERLYKVLQSIRVGKGMIELMSDRAKEQEKNKKKATLVNQYKLLEKKRQVHQGNKRIVQKIGHIKPRIGCYEEWDQHFEKFEKQMKKMSRVTQNVFDVETVITDKSVDLKNFLRQTLDFHQIQSSKEHRRKNKTVSKPRRKKEGSKKQREISGEGLNEEQIRIIKQEGKTDNDEQTEKARQLPKIHDEKAKLN